MQHVKSLLAFALLGTTFVTGCGGTPTEDDCNEYADHMVGLTLEEAKKQLTPTGDASIDSAAEAAMKTEADKAHPEFKKLCTDEGTKAEVECALKSKSIEQMEKDCS
ncbi:hypothetical protein PPSIR1_12518 [Plesiocystis pacifica SIR-1]|uniref:Lipoprotein n=1 Tax=Plesiocystis pacifica SIR-1 TaxID=391625 RepID=A6G008_9BACT|nr:hypothetical protein [Plesiocystis pacifica]EDM80705.1 hypothetical protein PPSIR1_12518 [Plesiocystis pacifica SIR-1]